MSLAVAECRDNIAFNCLAVNCYGLYALANVVGVADVDIIYSASELS